MTHQDPVHLFAGPPEAGDPLTAEIQAAMFQPLNVHDLAMVRCRRGPGCTEDHGAVIIRPGCHRDAPTWLVFTGVQLAVLCAECHAELCRIAVARP